MVDGTHPALVRAVLQKKNFLLHMVV